MARHPARGHRTLDLLLLSGGGQHGACGAAFCEAGRQLAVATPDLDLGSAASGI